MWLTVRSEPRRLRIFWRTCGAHDVHDVLFGRVRVGLYGGILRDAHKIAIWKRVVVALREFLREIRTERERSIAGARSQQRGALPRLNPAQEPIPVRLLKFARHIRLTNESRVRQLRIFAGYVNTTTCECVYRIFKIDPPKRIAKVVKCDRA